MDFTSNLNHVWLFLIAGLVFGSFCTSLSYRLINGGFGVLRSFCPSCKSQLKFLNLIPILSFLCQKGKCAKCAVKIPREYFAIEIWHCILAVLCYFASSDPVSNLMLFLVFFGLTTLSIVDIKTFIIPDTMVLLLLGCGLYFKNFIYCELDYTCLLLIVPIILFKFLYEVARKIITGKYLEVIGFGDIKLFACSVLLTKYVDFSILIFLSGLFGVVFYLVWSRGSAGLNNSSKAFPFGPSISAALFIVMIYRFYLAT